MSTTAPAASNTSPATLAQQTNGYVNSSGQNIPPTGADAVGQGTTGFVDSTGAYNRSPVAPSPIAADTLGQGISPIKIPPPPLYNPPVRNVTPPAGTTPNADGTVTPTPPADTNQPGSIQDWIKSQLINDSTGISSEGATRTALNAQAGLDQMVTDKTNAYNAYIQAQTDLKNKVADFQANNPQGMSDQGRSQLLAQIQREGDAHVSNLQVAYQISQGALADAQKTIDDKITAQFQPMKDNADMMTKIATINNNDLTDSQKFQLTQKADALKTETSNVQKAAEDIHQTLLKNGTYAQAAPAVDKVMNDYVNGKISAADAQSQMYAVASPYGVAPAGAGGISANLPTVALAPSGIPDPATQAAFLKNLPTDISTLVKGLTDYSINPSTFATRLLKGAPGMTRADAISLAKQYDPTYSEQQYASRQALMTNFAQGKYSQNINALNTAIGHLADIPANFDKLGNAGFVPYNWVANKVASTFGSGNITAASTNINAAVGELATTFKGGGATDQEISNLGTVNSNSSPAQAKSFVQTSIDLLNSRLNALQETYTSGMGKPPATSFLSPTNMATLSNLKNQGYDVKVPGVYFTDPIAYTKADTNNAAALTSVRTAHPELTPAQATQLAQYLQEHGQI